MEREAVFFERMSLLETGIQMFDSVLAGFLRERLAAGWPQVCFFLYGLKNESLRREILELLALLADYSCD